MSQLYNEAQIIPMAFDWNARVCKPPLDDPEEVMGVVRKICARAEGRLSVEERLTRMTGRRLSARDRQVLLGLYYWWRRLGTHADGLTFGAPHDRIARLARVAKRTIPVAYEALQADGLIRYDERPHPRKRGWTVTFVTFIGPAADVLRGDL